MKNVTLMYTKTSVILLSSLLFIACNNDESNEDEIKNDVIAEVLKGNEKEIEENIEIIPEDISSNIYIQTVYNEDALKMRLVFDRIDIPDGSYIEVIDSSNVSQIFKNKSSLEQGIVVLGNSATIKVILPNILSKASLNLKKVIIEEDTSGKGLIGEDERVPLVCLEGTEMYPRSLAASNQRFGGWGSGAIVGNGKYVLTNAHVVGNSKLVGESIEGNTVLGWYSENCNNNTQNIDDTVFIRTDKLIVQGVGGSGRDYALVKLNEFDVENSGALEVFGSMNIKEAGENKIGDEIYIPQYGNGGLQPMVIGYLHNGKDATITNVGNINENISYKIDSQSGSSGSPVISKHTNEIVGVHWGGGSGVNASNVAVALSTLIKEVLPAIDNNLSTIGKGKFKGHKVDIIPFLNPDYPVITIPKDSYLEPLDGTTMNHHDTYSELHLKSQNTLTGNIIKKVYYLTLKNENGYQNLSQSTSSLSSLIILGQKSNSVENKISNEISWLPLKVVDLKGNTIQNKIIHITNEQYNPFLSPFDISEPNTIKDDLIISDVAISETLSIRNDGAQYGYVGVYKGEAPQTLGNNSPVGTHANIYVPLKDDKGNEIVAKFKGYKVTACSIRPMNSTVGCNGAQYSTFRVVYDANENLDLLKPGIYKGILPVFAQAGDSKKNILVNIKLTVPTSEPEPKYDYIYPNEVKSYQAGTVVYQPKDGHIYECKPAPYSGFCSQWNPTTNQYEPGVGSAWPAAWIKLN